MPLELQKLIEFNPAIVYGFEPESTTEYQMATNGTEANLRNALFPHMGQHIDMYHAYMYAQETLLPLFKRGQANKITPAQLVNHIKSIHERIAKTLCSFNANELEAQGIEVRSGHYTTGHVLRWHYGSQMNISIGLYLVGRLDNECPTLEHFVKKYKPDEMPEADFRDFMRLITRYYHDESMLVDPMVPSLQGVPDRARKTLQAFNKLSYNHQMGKLSDADCRIIAKVVKIPRHPTKFAACMLDYAKDVLDTYYALDDNDLDAVSAFLGKVFYGIVDIHPFGNGNGRTATCLINIFSRALGKPSFLLRAPGDRSDTTSSYAKAIEVIDEDSSLLNKHIRGCIERVIQEGPYANPMKESIMQARVGIYEICHKIMQEYPEVDVEATYKDTEKKLKLEAMVMSMMLRDEDVLTRFIVQRLHEEFKQTYAGLEHNSQTAFSYMQQGFFNSRRNKSDVTALLSLLIPERVPTKKKEKSGADVYLYRFNDKVERDRMFEELTSETCFSVKKRASKDEFYLSVEAIDINALEARVSDSSKGYTQ